jgi:hypothetical protein
MTFIYICEYTCVCIYGLIITIIDIYVFTGDVKKCSKAGGLHKKFKLDGSIATSNMTMFDLNSKICRYKSPLQILQDFFEVCFMMMFTEKITLRVLQIYFICIYIK